MPNYIASFLICRPIPFITCSMGRHSPEQKRRKRRNQEVKRKLFMQELGKNDDETDNQNEQ